MESKFVIFTLLITLAFANGREASKVRTSNEMISAEKESRIIDIPLIGGIFLLASQVLGVIISKASSLLEYKFAALSVVSSLVCWLLQHYILVIIGTVAVVGLCAVTSFFSAEPAYEIDHLVRAARSVDLRTVKYGRLI